MNLKKKVEFRADRSVPGCVVVLESQFPNGKQEDFSYFILAISLTSPARKC